jgi:uncharacterized protein
MPILSPRLRRLDGALASLAATHDEVMFLSTLDGYVTGVILCPEAIEAAEWLPLLWGGERGGSAFADELDDKWFADLVKDHAVRTAATLDKGGRRYRPFLEVDVGKGEILWELWIDGFAAAMELRPGSWAKIEEAEGAPANALAAMMTLIEIARDESDLDRDRIDRLTEEAPDLIAAQVATLYAAGVRAVSESGTAPFPSSSRVGRNEICPCGSGAKHKRCCGRA